MLYVSTGLLATIQWYLVTLLATVLLNFAGNVTVRYLVDVLRRTRQHSKNLNLCPVSWLNRNNMNSIWECGNLQYE
jgi:hypothetical protein